MSAAWTRETSAGLLVTFEGGEGSGKSTQVERLARWLETRGHDVVTAREPGTTTVGEMVRRIVLQAAPDELAPEAELALYLAARAQLVAEVIGPALGAGRVVLCDRYGDSSVAYQGYGRGLDPAWIEECNRRVTGGLRPDLTVLIDVPVEAGAARRGDRPPDRLERAGRAFHERVRAGYHRLAEAEPERFAVVDGRKGIEDIQRAIRERMGELLEARAPQRTESE